MIIRLPGLTWMSMPEHMGERTTVVEISAGKII